MEVWPQYEGSDEWMFGGLKVVVVGVNCDARRRVGKGGKEWAWHWVQLSLREGRGTKWREWMAGVGVGEAEEAVVVVRPDRYVFAVYAMEKGRAWRRWIRMVGCRRSIVTYCHELPFPVVRDVREVLFEERKAV